MKMFQIVSSDAKFLPEKELINSVNSAKVLHFKEVKKKTKVNNSSKIVDPNKELIERLVKQAIKNCLNDSDKLQTIESVQSSQSNQAKISFKAYHEIRNEVVSLNRNDLKFMRLGLLLDRIPEKIQISYLANYHKQLNNSQIAPTLSGYWDVTIFDCEAHQLSQMMGININSAAKIILCHELGHYVDFVIHDADLIRWAKVCQEDNYACEKRAWDYGKTILYSFDETLLISYERCQKEFIS